MKITEEVKPEDFKKEIKWIVWYPNLINLLGAIIGRSGVPLNYICRKINLIIHATYGYFIDEYVDTVPVTGQVYQTDAAEFHNYIVKFIPGNSAAEDYLVPHAQQNNGRIDFIAVKNHYKRL